MPDEAYEGPTDADEAIGGFDPFGGIWTPPAPQLYAGEIIALFQASIISGDEARDLLNRTYGIELD